MEFLPTCTEIFAANLQHLLDESERDGSPISKSQLAEDAEVNPSAVSKWLKGNTLPAAPTLDFLARYFGIKTHQWLQPHEDWGQQRVSPEEALRLYLRSNGYILRTISRPKE